MDLEKKLEVLTNEIIHGTGDPTQVIPDNVEYTMFYPKVT